MPVKNLIPRGDRVLIEKTASEKVGLIYVPDKVKKASLRGKIIAVGELVTDYQVGDDVLFGTYATLNLQLQEHDDLKSYDNSFIINCEDIVAIVRG